MWDLAVGFSVQRGETFTGLQIQASFILYFVKPDCLLRLCPGLSQLWGRPAFLGSAPPYLWTVGVPTALRTARLCFVAGK